MDDTKRLFWMRRSVNLFSANLATASFFEGPAGRLERKVDRW